MASPHYSLLILEDSPEDRALYYRYLSQDILATYDVIEIDTGLKAWQYLAQHKPDLILLDYQLPDIDGLEFLYQLRSQFESWSIPVIMLTGLGNEAIAAQAIKAGAAEYLVKAALTASRLSHAIYSTLEKNRLKQELRTQEQQQLLLARILLRIRQFLHLEEILSTTVQEVREFLKADRVVVYQFDQQMNGTIVAESVLPQWKPSLNCSIHDTCFRETQGIAYRDGKIRGIADIYQAGLTPCHIDLLEQFEVKANLVVPILLNTEATIQAASNHQLWGLLIAHQCSTTREWEINELELLQQLAVQMAVAITQAQLYEHLQNLNTSLEQKVQERTQELQASERRFRAIFDNTFQFTGLLNTQGILIEINQTALNFGGLQLEDVINRPFWETRWWQISPATQDELKQAIARAAQGEFIRYEVDLLGMEGIATIDFSLRPVKDESGQVLMLIPEGRDITDHKLAEAQLHQTNEQLAASNAELARATRLKDEFLANMSHELRTPLNAVLGISEALQQGIFGVINDKQRQGLQTIERSGHHLLSLINDILDLSKIEAEQLELNYTAIAINQLCQSSLVFIKQQALQKRIHLEVKIPPRLPKLFLDERRIRQVLINLLNNAVKFTPEGGRITLEVTRQKQTASVTETTSQTDFIRIAVIDTGIGIAPENLNKLFQPFVQIDSALNRQYAGSGLGLALVKRLVEIHGGKVGVRSELGVGSCFTVDLPCDHLSETSYEPVKQESSDVHVTFNPTTEHSPLILLAEDNEANVFTISGYLEALGYRLILARNGQEAIALTKLQFPDLILMDIQMPGIDGLEAIQTIRLDHNFVNIPIIALTALAMPGDRERCLATGANDYITKPIKLKQLANIIQQLLTAKDIKK